MCTGLLRLIVVAICLLFGTVTLGIETPQNADQGATILHQIGRLEEKVDGLKQSSSSLTPLWIAFAALLVSGLSVLVNYVNGRRTLTQKSNEERAKVLQDRLDRFYGPLR